MANEVVVDLKARDLASTPIRNATRSISQDVRNLNNDMQRNISIAGGLRSSWLGLGTVLAGTGLTVGAVAAGFLKLANAASDMSESQSKVKQVFQDSAEDILKWSEDSAKAFGLSSQAALEAAGTYGNLLTSLGLARGEAASMSKSIVELAADLASFNNTSIDEALVALQAGLLGEAEPMRRFGAAIDAASVELAALKLGLAETKEEITEADKVTARYALILDQTKNAQGDFAKTSDGLANSQRTLTGLIGNLQVQLGKALEPALLDVVAATSKWIELNGDEAVKEFSRAVEGAITVVDSLKKTLDVLVNSAPYKITIQLAIAGAETVANVLGGIDAAVTEAQGFLSGVGSALKSLAPSGGVPNMPNLSKGLLDDVVDIATLRKPNGPVGQAARAVEEATAPKVERRPIPDWAFQEEMEAAGAGRGEDLTASIREEAGSLTASLSELRNAMSGGGGRGGSSVKDAAEELAERMQEAAELTEERNLRLAEKQLEEAALAAKAALEAETEAIKKKTEAEERAAEALLGLAGFLSRTGGTQTGFTHTALDGSITYVSFDGNNPHGDSVRTESLADFNARGGVLAGMDVDVP